MSTKEQIYNIIEGFSEQQLVQIYTMISSIKEMLDEERADDEFCRQMYLDYLNDPGEDGTVTLEEAARELGIDLNEVQDHNK